MAALRGLRVVRAASCASALSLAAACHGPPAGGAPAPELATSVLRRITWAMDCPKAREALEDGGARVDGDCELKVSKGYDDRHFEVKAARWEATIQFHRAKLSSIWVMVRSPSSLEEAHRIVEPFTLTPVARVVGERAKLMWKGPRTDLRVELVEERGRLRVEEHWEGHAQGKVCAYGAGFGDVRGVRAFRWEASSEEVERAAEGIKLQLGPWLRYECLRDCGPLRRAVRFSDGERSGTLVFLDDRLKSVDVSSDEAAGGSAAARTAAYKKRFGPPCEEHRDIAETWEDAAAERSMSAHFHAPPGDWSASLSVRPPSGLERR